MNIHFTNTTKHLLCSRHSTRGTVLNENSFLIKGDLVSTPYPLLVSDTLSTSCLVAVPVFVELCCIFFQTCLQVLLSHVTFAGFYKTKSAFIKRNIKK